ncbi:MAG: FHA domain-containing protein [Verrucomicrobia bacterium]|nr:FHA domain-containing protein [Verrucomicrobiota bacterium]
MVQLQFLTGKKAGSAESVRRFPCVIGRAAEADLPVQEDGVWERHCELSFQSPHGFQLTVQPQALATVNGQPFETGRLCNGDLIEIGALKLRFWLAETRQHSLRLREALTWLALAALALGQVALIYWLLR